MTLHAWLSVATALFSVGLLAFTRLSADLVLLSGLSLLLLTGVLSPQEALAGFANEGMITVGVLYVVVAGLQETGALAWVGASLFGKPRSLVGAQARLMLPTAAASAFLNNTPLVAMLIPTVSDWAKKQGLAASKLMIPLSYAAILGGTCSLIGTSTNLVVNGLLLSETDLPGLGMFTLAWVGVPSAALGVLYVLLVSRWLLPDRRAPVSRFDDLRQYTMELQVEQGPLVGQTIEAAGLRQLPGAFLADIERGEQVLAAVSPQTVLEPGDRLRFVGVVEAMTGLRKLRGLTPATEQLGKLDAAPERLALVEAVVSDRCPLIGKSIREGRFRTVYGAVVVAVARGGERVRQKIGDVVLRPGDTLLLETRPSFAARQRDAKDFYLVSAVADSSPPRHGRAPLALALLIGMVTLVTFNLLSMLEASLLAAGLLLVSNCVTWGAARRSLDWPVLLTIAASFGLGRALEVSGAAGVVAGGLTDLGAGKPWLSLVLIYGVTTLFTEMITNNAAAVLVFPIAQATAATLDVSFLPFAVAIMMAASASFATPIGYQTNLMVLNPGGYRFSDYLRVGLPLNLLLWALSSLLIPVFYPF